MIDAFEAIPGPAFALFYLLWCIVGFILCWRWGAPQALPPDRRPLLRLPHEDDPYFLAWLEGNQRRMTDTAMVSLVQQGCIVYDAASKKLSAVQPPSGGVRLEQAVFESVAGRGGPVAEQVAHIKAVQDVAGFLAGKYEQVLIDHRLQGDNGPHRRAVWLMAVATVALGLFRLVMAMTLGRHNIVFLEILLMLGPAAMLTTLARVFKLNDQGLGYLQSLRTQYASLQRPGASPHDRLLAAGLFGVSVLAATELAFLPALMPSFLGSPGGGDGGGGCGGGGCGGGGCGGGGCGG